MRNIIVANITNDQIGNYHAYSDGKWDMQMDRPINFDKYRSNGDLRIFYFAGYLGLKRERLICMKQMQNSIIKGGCNG